MNKKSIYLVLAIVVQFGVILYTTISSQMIINNGEVLKFRLRGYDPYDMFRGNYIRIRFMDDEVYMVEDVGEEGYVEFVENEEGYSVPFRVFDCPGMGTMKVKLSYDEERQGATIIYPFDRVWKNQEECEVLEKKINVALEEGRDVYALVAVKRGEGRIVDIEIE